MAQLAKARDCNGNCNLEIGCSTHPQEILFFYKKYIQKLLMNLEYIIITQKLFDVRTIN